MRDKYVTELGGLDESIGRRGKNVEPAFQRRGRFPETSGRNGSMRDEMHERDGEGVKSFLDMMAPGIIKFEPDYYVCGNTYRCT